MGDLSNVSGRMGQVLIIRRSKVRALPPPSSPNEIKDIYPLDNVNPDVCQIPLTQGFFALIDSGDYALISKHKWQIFPRGKLLYAKTSINRKTVLMHALILPKRPGFDRDHINRNGLDNRRSNLRYATRKQNLANSASRGRNRTGLKGVTIHPCGKYMARVNTGDKSHYLGLFVSPEEAARAYDRKAREVFGEFAYLNFPKEIA